MASTYSLRSIVAAALLGPGLVFAAAPSGCDCGTGPRLPETSSVSDCGGTDAPDNRHLTNDVAKLANKFGFTKQQIKDAIHAVKDKASLGGREVRVDVRTGEVYPQTPRGGVGDSVGNILDYLP